MTSQAEIEAAIEAILFATADPVSRARLFELFEPEGTEKVEQALAEVLQRYRRPGDDDPREGHGVIIDQIGSSLRLVTRPDLHGYLRKFFDISGRTKLSMAALEVLAIVAYRQPITGPEIQELRGKNSSAVIKTLLEKRLIRISGRKEVVGKPFLYATTSDFLLHFGLEKLQDLPPLEEFEETFLGDGDFAGDGLEGEDREERILRQAAEAEEARSEIEELEEESSDEAAMHEEEEIASLSPLVDEPVGALTPGGNEGSEEPT